MPGRWAAPPAPAMMAARPRDFGRGGVFEQQVGGAVRRNHLHFVRDAQLFEQLGSRLERLPVGLRTHDDADQLVSFAKSSTRVLGARSGRPAPLRCAVDVDRRASACRCTGTAGPARPGWSVAAPRQWPRAGIRSAAARRSSCSRMCDQPLAQLLRRMRGPLARALAGRQRLSSSSNSVHAVQLWTMSQAVDASRIPELSDIVALALAEARAAGATQAEADVSLQQGLNVTVRLGEVETIEYQRDRGAGHHGVFQRRQGLRQQRRPAARGRARRWWPRPAPSRATPRATNSRAWPMPADMAREIPDLDLYHPWELTPGAGHRDGARLRGRRAWRWTGA